jgi:hypothetical protein
MVRRSAGLADTSIDSQAGRRRQHLPAAGPDPGDGASPGRAGGCPDRLTGGPRAACDAGQRRNSSDARREDTLSDQLPAQPDGIGVVDRQHVDRHATDRRQADQLRSAPAEVLLPMITTGMVETNNLIYTFIKSSNIRTLIPVASGAGQGQVVESGLPLMPIPLN